IGPATRLAEYLTAAVKEYDAEVTLGVATDTWDAAGKVVAEAPMTVDAAAVERALEPLRGPILQRPPAFSARRAAGRRAYGRARGRAAARPDPAAPAGVAGAPRRGAPRVRAGARGGGRRARAARRRDRAVAARSLRAAAPVALGALLGRHLRARARPRARHAT